MVKNYFFALLALCVFAQNSSSCRAEPGASAGQASLQQLIDKNAAEGGKFELRPDGTHVLTTKDGRRIEFTPGKEGWKVFTPKRDGTVGSDLPEQRAHYQVLKEQTVSLSDQDPRTFGRLVEMSSFFARDKNWKDAEVCARRLVPIAEHKFGQESAQSIDASESLAAVLSEQGKPEEAANILEKQLPFARKLFANNPAKLAAIENDTAYAQLQSQQYDRSEKNYKSAYSLLKTDKIEPVVRKYIIEGYAALLEKTGRKNLASKLRQPI